MKNVDDHDLEKLLAKLEARWPMRRARPPALQAELTRRGAVEGDRQKLGPFDQMDKL